MNTSKRGEGIRLKRIIRDSFTVGAIAFSSGQSSIPTRADTWMIRYVQCVYCVDYDVEGEQRNRRNADNGLDGQNALYSSIHEFQGKLAKGRIKIGKRK